MILLMLRPRTKALLFLITAFAILLFSGCGGGDGTSNVVSVASSDDSEDVNFKSAHALATTGSSDAPFTPAQIRQLYNIPAPVGPSKTVIIVPYHYSQLQSDINKFFAKYELPAPVLNIINLAGNAQNSNWAVEATIDVTMVAIVNPQTTISVIQAKSAYVTDILAAMQTAQNMFPGAVISMSWGAPEFATQGSMYSLFSKTSNTWVAASGDNGYVSYPASQPGVIAVGGTTVKLGQSGNRQSETPWQDSGCGISAYELKPAYQNIAIVSAANSTAYRSVPDISFIADLKPGVSFYNSLIGGWFSAGGTSVSAPLFAGIVSLANAARIKRHLQPFSSAIGSPVGLQPHLYDLLSSNGGPNNSTVLYDVGREVTCTALKGSKPTSGYTVVSGLGTVNVQALIEYLNTKP